MRVWSIKVRRLFEGGVYFRHCLPSYGVYSRAASICEWRLIEEVRYVVQCGLPCWERPCGKSYRRSSFDCEILLIANCEFFHNSQSKELQEKEYAINNGLPAWQFAIIRIAIWLV